MWKNYLKVSLRNLRKRPGYTFINVFGLAVGLACCILILLFVRDELSYDRHHEQADRIYRIRLEALLGEQEVEGPISPAPMAEALKRDFPEVVQATRLFSFTDDVLVRRGETRFIEDRFHFADSTIFDVFTLPLLQGDPATALTEPNTVVLSASMARKYFGDANPVGQTLRIDDEDEYGVTGVYEDFPSQSHFHSDFLASMVSLDASRNPLWVSNNFHTYLVLREDAAAADLEAKFPAVVRKYAGPQVEDILGITVDEFYASGGRYAFYLQPLTDIHLHSNYDYEIEPNSDVTYVYAVSAIALLILLIACINFMNLATARSAGRAKEVGIRKVLGSNRRQLTAQFLMESTVLSVIATVLAVGMAALALPSFNALAGKHLSLAPLIGPFLPVLLGLTLLVGLLAGSYPAFFLASFRIVHVLKGKLREGAGSAGLRSGLVVFQFAISIALIIGTTVVYQQVDYVQSKRLGYEKEHVVIIERAEVLGDQQETFKQEVEGMPGVVAAGAAQAPPGRLLGDSSFMPEGAGGEDLHSLRLMWVDYDAIETLGFELVAGRAFSRDFPSDSMAVILNEAAVRSFGWQDDPVGRRIVAPGFGPDQQSQTLTVVGVVEDFHFQSLHTRIRPLGLFLGRTLRYLAVRLRPDPGSASGAGSVPGTLAALETAWQSFAPGHPFRYSFLDDDVDALYRAEQRTARVIGICSGLAVLVACLGLFGLAAFTAEQRTKEIGVRKVLGATVPSLIVLLSKDFARLVVIALVVAAPVAYFGMSRWLEDFAYRTELAWWIIPLAGLAALLIALLTVSYQSVKAALADPVQSLRYE